jgi:hypothetical protein
MVYSHAMSRGRWLAFGVAVVTLSGSREAGAAEEPLPWSRGTLAPGVAIEVSPGRDVTSLSVGVGLDYFVGRGFSLGLTFSDEVLVYSSSIRGRLPNIEKQLPTNIFYVVPTARWVFFRRFRFSPYVFAGIGPAVLNNGNGILGHWQAGPSAYIGLVGGLFLDVGVVFSGHFPAAGCDERFAYRPPEPSGVPVQVGECAFSWAPKIGLAYAFGFGKQRERARRSESQSEAESESGSEIGADAESGSAAAGEGEGAAGAEVETDVESGGEGREESGGAGPDPSTRG